MTKMTLLQAKGQDKQLLAIGSKSKNHLLVTKSNSWIDVAGLSWMFVETPDYT